MPRVAHPKKKAAAAPAPAAAPVPKHDAAKEAKERLDAARAQAIKENPGTDENTLWITDQTGKMRPVGAAKTGAAPVAAAAGANWETDEYSF